jgi:hypothetical protein
MGIHLQARTGDFGFLTIEESLNDLKDKKMYVLKSSVSWKDIGEK